MKISTLDRCLMDMDMSQNPFLCQLISTSELNPAEIKDLMQLASSVNCQVQLATVIKSGLKSILVTIKNSLVTIPALSVLQFIKPENISPTLTFDEHRSIIVYARGGNQTSLFAKPIFQQPFFLIAKNMIFSMMVQDVTSLLQQHTNNKPPPVKEALKKLDEYFDTIPDAPIGDTEFQSMTKPDTTNEDDFWAKLSKSSKANSNTESDIVSLKRKSQSLPLSESTPKRPRSAQSFGSWTSAGGLLPNDSIMTDEQIRSFDAELAEIFSYPESDL